MSLTMATLAARPGPAAKRLAENAAVDVCVCVCVRARALPFWQERSTPRAIIPA
jgi:hypothetical protein